MGGAAENMGFEIISSISSNPNTTIDMERLCRLKEP
jgi:hypothetical protein